VGCWSWIVGHEILEVTTVYECYAGPMSPTA
jgi:hypothetical protein